MIAKCLRLAKKPPSDIVLQICNCYEHQRNIPATRMVLHSQALLKRSLG